MSVLSVLLRKAILDGKRRASSRLHHRRQSELFPASGKRVACEARPRGGFRHGKLPPHRDFILKTVAARSDITMPELAAILLAEKAIVVAPATLSRFLIGGGFSFKKNASGKRTRQA